MMSYESSDESSSYYGNDILAKRVLNNLGKHDVVPMNTLEKWAEEILFRQEGYDHYFKDYAINREINQENQELISRLSHPKKTAPVTVDPDLTFTPAISNKSREIAKDFDRRHFAAPKAPRDDVSYEPQPTFAPQIDARSKILAEIALAKREKAGRKLYDPKPIVVKEEVQLEESRKISSKGLENFLDRNSEWYHHQNEKKKERVLHSHIDAVERELEECTFQPQLIARGGNNKPYPPLKSKQTFSPVVDRKNSTTKAQIHFAGENKSKAQRKYSSVYEWKKSVAPDSEAPLYQDDGDLYAEDMESGTEAISDSNGISRRSIEQDFNSSFNSSLGSPETTLVDSLHISDQIPIQSAPILIRSASIEKRRSEANSDDTERKAGAGTIKHLDVDISNIGTSPVSSDVPSLAPNGNRPKALTKLPLEVVTTSTSTDAPNGTTTLTSGDVTDLSPDEPKRGDVVAFENMQRNIVNTSSGRMLNVFPDGTSIAKYKKLEEGSDNTPRQDTTQPPESQEPQIALQAPPSLERLVPPVPQQQQHYEQAKHVYEQQQYEQQQDQLELYHILQQQQMQQLQQLLIQQQQIQQLIQIHQEQMENTKKAKQQVTSSTTKPRTPTQPVKSVKISSKPSTPQKPSSPQKSSSPQKPSTSQKPSPPQKISNSSSRSCPQLINTPKQPLPISPQQSPQPHTSTQHTKQTQNAQFQPIPSNPQHSPHYQPLPSQHSNFQPLPNYHTTQQPSPRDSFSLVDQSYYDSGEEEDPAYFDLLPTTALPTNSHSNYTKHARTKSLELEMDSKEEEMWDEIEAEFLRERNYMTNGRNLEATNYFTNTQRQPRHAIVGTKQPSTAKAQTKNQLRTVKKN